MSQSKIIQYQVNNYLEVKEFLDIGNRLIRNKDLTIEFYLNGRYLIVKPNDYIVKNANGDIYICDYEDCISESENMRIPLNKRSADYIRINDIFNILYYLADPKEYLKNLHPEADNIVNELKDELPPPVGKHARKYFVNYVMENIIPFDPSDISDGDYTYSELYYQRMIMFSVICNTYKEHAWKSKLHVDGTMYDGYFIVGITTPAGDYGFHLDLDLWFHFDVKELERAPKWDGFRPKDVGRLMSLLKMGN